MKRLLIALALVLAAVASSPGAADELCIDAGTTSLPLEPICVPLP